jgi:sugar phosphate isomerase/epimerase
MRELVATGLDVACVLALSGATADANPHATSRAVTAIQVCSLGPSADSALVVGLHADLKPQLPEVSVAGMKLCFSTLACPAWDLQQIVDAAVACGMAGVDFRGIGEEIDITRVPAFNQDLPDTLALLRQHGLRVPCLNTSVTLVSPAPERWQMMLDECSRYARLGRLIGTHYVRIFGGAVPRGMTLDEARSMAQRHLRQLVKICGKWDCQPLVETHDDWATADSVMSLLHEFDPAEAGVLWDVEHPCRRAESPLDSALGMKRFIRHVHFKDSVRADGKSLPRLLGQGDLPLRAAIEAMRAISYDGWICLETEKRWHPLDAPDPEVSLPQFVQWMVQAGGPACESPDSSAAPGEESGDSQARPPA